MMKQKKYCNAEGTKLKSSKNNNNDTNAVPKYWQTLNETKTKKATTFRFFPKICGCCVRVCVCLCVLMRCHSIYRALVFYGNDQMRTLFMLLLTMSQYMN